MNISRLKKAETLATLTSCNKTASSGFLVNFGGISSNEMNIIRKKFYDCKLQAFVAKNTLIQRAITSIAIAELSTSHIKQLTSLLSGRHLMVFGHALTWEDTKTLKAIVNAHNKLNVSFMFAADGVVGDSTTWNLYSNLPTLPEAQASLTLELYKPLMSLVATLIEAFNLPSNE
jgi:ribosomal protein L10